MKIIVFGATGNTGRRVLAQGIQSGHEMTAFVRNSGKINAQLGEHSAGRVKVIVDDMMDPVSVESELRTAAADGARLVRDVSGNHEGFDRASRAGSPACNDGNLAHSDSGDDQGICRG